jgi:hypothetical protein
MSNITARLEDVIAEDLGVCWIVWGRINGDTAGRFKDGEVIHTSYVKLLDGDVVYTRNSIYEIASWRSPEAEAAARELAGKDWSFN